MLQSNFATTAPLVEAYCSSEPEYWRATRYQLMTYRSRPARAHLQSIELDTGIPMCQSFLQGSDCIPSSKHLISTRSRVTSGSKGVPTHPVCPSLETLSHTSRFRAQSSDARFSSVALATLGQLVSWRCACVSGQRGDGHSGEMEWDDSTH